MHETSPLVGINQGEFLNQRTDWIHHRIKPNHQKKPWKKAQKQKQKCHKHTGCNRQFTWSPFTTKGRIPLQLITDLPTPYDEVTVPTSHEKWWWWASDHSWNLKYLGCKILTINSTLWLGKYGGSTTILEIFEKVNLGVEKNTQKYPPRKSILPVLGQFTWDFKNVLVNQHIISCKMLVERCLFLLKSSLFRGHSFNFPALKSPKNSHITWISVDSILRRKGGKKFVSGRVHPMEIHNGFCI